MANSPIIYDGFYTIFIHPTRWLGMGVLNHQQEIRRSAVEVGSLSLYLQGFIHPNGYAGFLPST